MKDQPTIEELQSRIVELEKENSTLRATASENHFEVMAELSFEAIAIHEDGVLLEANKQYFRMFGYERDELIGKQAITKTVAPESLAKIKRQVKSGSTSAYEIVGIRKDGTRFPLEIQARYTEYKGKRRRVGVLRDLSERRKLENSLIIEQRRMEMLLEAFPGFIYLQAPDYSVRYANPYFIEHYGQPKDKPCYKLLWNRDQPCEPCNTFKVFETKVPAIWEWSGSPDGKTYMIYDHPFIDVDGSELVLEIGIDVTERKLAENAVKEGEKRFESFFRNSPIETFVWEVCAEGIVLRDYNDAALTNTSETVAKFLGVTAEEIYNDRPDILELFRDCQMNRRKIHFETDYFTRGTQRLRHIVYTFVPVSDSLIMLHAEDKTESLKLQARLNQVQKMESIGNLAGGIAHDFNNILASILGYTELALDEAGKGTPVEENIQEIYLAGRRAKDLVKQILTFARQSDEKVSPIHPGRIAREVLNFMRSTIPAFIEIQQDIDSNAYIMGNTTQLHQLMMNLCTNAAFAMDESDGILKVSVKDVMLDKNDLWPGMLAGEFVEIKVSDTGSGIDPEIRGQIFEPYFTTKKIGQGTGMGLAVAHGIIVSYGGNISVESQVNEGSCFTIYLPVTENHENNGNLDPSHLPRGEERILFVDDEKAIVRMTQRILERLGYMVTACSSSQVALELFQTSPDAFDLVISDMTMPNLTGDKLAIELHKQRSDILVILCTGFSKKLTGESADIPGVKAILYKPIIKADLANTVRKVLDENACE